MIVIDNTQISGEDEGCKESIEVLLHRGGESLFLLCYVPQILRFVFDSGREMDVTLCGTLLQR